MRAILSHVTLMLAGAAATGFACAVDAHEMSGPSSIRSERRHQMGALPSSTAATVSSIVPSRSEVATPAVNLYVESGIRHSARSVAFSSDGQFIAAGSLDRSIKIWSARTGRELATLPNQSMSTSIAFLPSTPVVAANGEDGSISVWDIRTGKRTVTLTCSDRPSPSLAVDPRRSILVCADWGASVIRRWSLSDYRVQESTSIDGMGPGSKLNSDGSLVSINDAAGRLNLVDTRTSAVIGTLPDSWAGPAKSIAFAPRRGKIATIRDIGGPLASWSWLGHGVAELEQTIAVNLPHAVAYTPDEQEIAYAAESGDVVLVDTGSLAETRRFTSHANRVENVGLFSESSVLAVQVWYDGHFAIDLNSGAVLGKGAPLLSYDNANTASLRGELFGRRFVVRREEDRVRIENEHGKEISTLVVLDKIGAWVAIDPAGRFDTNMDLNDVKGVHWAVAGQGLDVIPLEILMRSYYEPRLLPRLLMGTQFPALPSLALLNQSQPHVNIVAVEHERPVFGSANTEPETVQVTVEVAGDGREFGLEGNKRRMTTGVYDLRLFRDGQLVEQWPAEPAATSTQQLSREQELEQWRKDHRVVEYTEGANKVKRIVFKGIRLPRLAGKDKVVFSAYAFNVDRVKSETAKWSYELPKGLKPRVPRAYIVTIGVNAFEDKAWDLNYAANDARQSGSELKKRLEAVLAQDGSKQYEKVVWVPLISDATKEELGKARQFTVSQADKNQIEAVLKTLAGQAADTQALSGIESAGKLRRVNPEDLVIIVISTHGMVDERGNFYFLPADIGREFLPSSAADRATKARMLAQAVSTDELAQWLRGLDAVDQVMIIDACHSAASVQNAEFKPGPMGSRGLGQLAYDKGMRILAATQVQQQAVDGTDATKMGLLIYALIEDGLRAGKADSAPKDGRIMLSEWLNYASQRVPSIFQGIHDGTMKGTRGTVEYSPDSKTDAAQRASLQQPSLFDFAKGRDLPLAVDARPQ